MKADPRFSVSDRESDACVLIAGWNTPNVGQRKSLDHNCWIWCTTLSTGAPCWSMPSIAWSSSSPNLIALQKMIRNNKNQRSWCSSSDRGSDAYVSYRKPKYSWCWTSGMPWIQFGFGPSGPELRQVIKHIDESDRCFVKSDHKKLAVL